MTDERKGECQVEAPQEHIDKAASLIGRYVHTHSVKGLWTDYPDLRPINKQGLVVAQHGDYYEVQWFSFSDGLPNQSTMHRLDEMVFENWTFYLEQEDWSSAMDREILLISRASRPIRKKKQ